MKVRSLLVFVGLVLCAATRSADACSRGTVPGVALLLPTPQFVALSGTVLGYVQSRAPVNGVPQARGLEVRVDVNERGDAEVMEWYPLQLLPDCSNESWTDQELVTEYPTSSRVVAVAAVRSTDSTGARLVVQEADDFGHVARVDGAPVGPAGAFTFRGPQPKEPIGEYDAAATWREAHRVWREEYEAYRAVALIPSLDEPGRVRILGGLAYYSSFGLIGSTWATHDYEALMTWAKVSPASRRRLSQQFERIWKTPSKPR